MYLVGDLLFSMMFLRLYILFRCVYNYSLYTNGFSRKICNEYGFTSGARFSFKCLFQLYPLQTIWGMFLCIILLIAYLLRILEMSYSQPSLEIALFHNQFQQCLWLTVITITTVGYGDISPNTLPGQYITMACALSGASLISMLVVATTNLFDLDDS